MFDSRAFATEIATEFATEFATDDAPETAPASPTRAVSAPRPRRSRRATFLRWLRQTHLYLGLWGAALGMLFGATGIILNHRAVLRLPVALSQQKIVQLALPTQATASPAALAQWLQSQQQLAAHSIDRMAVLPAQRLQWGPQTVQQPERWQIRFNTPQRSVNAEYIPGNRFVQLEQSSATVIGTLARLHMASGVSAFWVILSDTIAASLIVLSLTGLLLWTQLHTVRTLGLLTSLGALLAALCYAWSW